MEICRSYASPYPVTHVGSRSWKAGDGDLAFRKRSGGPFLAKSGERYASPCLSTSGACARLETHVGSSSISRTTKNRCFRICLVVREMGLEPTRRCHH